MIFKLENKFQILKKNRCYFILFDIRKITVLWSSDDFFLSE